MFSGELYNEKNCSTRGGNSCRKMTKNILFILVFLIGAAVFGDGSETGCFIDVVFILDESASIWSVDFKNLLNFTQSVIDYFDVGPNRTHVGVMTYGTVARVIFQLNRYTNKNEMKTAVGNIVQANGQTYTHLALKRLREEMFSATYSRSWAVLAAIVITDGQSDFPPKTKEEAELCKAAGYRMFAVGVGTSVDQNELKAIASAPDHVFTVADYESLKTLREKIGGKACEVCANNPLDIVFILDESSSIIPADFRELRNFTQSLVDRFDVGLNRTRVGVMTFATNERVIFQVDRYTNKNDVKAAIGNIQQVSGNTATYLALKRLREDMFSATHSDPKHNRAAIVITDGQSQEPDKTKEQADLCKAAGYMMFAVGVGDSVVQSELEAIASVADNVFKVADYESLKTLQDILARKACERKA